MLLVQSFCLGNSGDSYTILWLYLLALDYIFKSGYNINFMFYIFYHNKKLNKAEHGDEHL
jgi:hypothetical protein